MRFTPALLRELEEFLRDLLELIQRCDKLDIFFFPSESTGILKERRYAKPPPLLFWDYLKSTFEGQIMSNETR